MPDTTRREDPVRRPQRRRCAFATSRTGSDYRARFLTTGNDYKDTQLQRGKRTHQPRHGPSHLRYCRRFQRLRRRGKQPQRRQLHHLQGTYTGSQSAYNGWYKFYYKIDARSAATNKEFQDVVDGCTQTFEATRHFFQPFVAEV